MTLIFSNHLLPNTETTGSGKFAGWRALAFELQFEPGFFEAYEWIYSPSTKEELDGWCSEARKKLK